MYLCYEKFTKMHYTVKIDAREAKAKSIINFLKELAKDYSFISVIEDNQELTPDMVEELEFRYNYMLEHPEDGESWEVVKNRILNK